MEILEFNYSGKKREFLKLKEDTTTLKGIDLGYITDDLKELVREAAPYLLEAINDYTGKEYIADSRNAILIESDATEEWKRKNQGAFEHFEKLLIGYRCFNKNKIEEINAV